MGSIKNQIGQPQFFQKLETDPSFLLFGGLAIGGRDCVKIQQLHSDNDSFGGWVVLKPTGNFNPQKWDDMDNCGYSEPTTWFYGYSEATTIGD